ncbi:MAG TPA: hypothetical protein VF656_19525 [Pyrinomonadaceae bacterium]
MSHQSTLLKLSIAVSLTSLWLLVNLVPAQAQEFDQYGRWINGFTEPWTIESDDYSREEIETAIKRWLRMNDGADAEWPGRYGTGGETHGTYLRWSPEAGYVMLSISTCEARVLSVDYGKVEASPGLVRFISERAAPKTSPAGSKHSHTRGRSPINTYLTIKWRGSRYLVPETGLAEFCDRAAGLGQYNNGLAEHAEDLSYSGFFGKSYKERAQVSEETPIVPEGFERFVKSPVEASVAAVGAKRIKRLTLEDGSFIYDAVRTLYLDAGSLHGIKRGMTLRVVESDADAEVKITRVGKRSSDGILVRRLDDNLNEAYKDWETEEIKEYPEARVGWRLTTSPLW